VRGYSVMVGYWGDEAATQRAIDQVGRWLARVDGSAAFSGLLPSLPGCLCSPCVGTEACDCDDTSMHA
jgi:hypothetical protein